MMPGLRTPFSPTQFGGGIEVIPWDPGSEHFEAIAELFLKTWPRRYVLESARRRLMEHATLSNFQGLVALSYSGQVTGFCYGHICLPGQWWHDQVEIWLGKERTALEVTGSFNFTELAVDEMFQRRGVGRVLLEAMINNCGFDYSTLSTPCDNTPALALYTRTGWNTLVPRMFFSEVSEPFCVMGRRLTE